MADPNSLPDPGGVFLVFEGLDGSGKTTQLELLAARLRKRGHQVLTTREPGGSPVGARLREIVLHYPGQLDERCEALLFAADRAHHVATVIKPALAAGKIVLCDRYLASSVAYQGGGRGLLTQEVHQLSTWATHGLIPELTFFLDLPVASVAGRLGENRDRIESAGEKFFHAVRDRFLAQGQGRQDWLILDAKADRQVLATQIWDRVEEILAPRQAGRS